MTNQSPIERVLTRMQDEEMSMHEMSMRIRKRPGTIRMLLEHATRTGTGERTDDGLRPIEKVVLRAREDGETYGQIASRIGRSGPHARRIAGYARFKLGEEPLAFD